MKGFNPSSQEQENSKTLYYSSFNVFDENLFHRFLRYQKFKSELQKYLGTPVPLVSDRKCSKKAGKDWETYAHASLYFESPDGRKNYVTGKQFFDRALKVWLEILASIASASPTSISALPEELPSTHGNWKGTPNGPMTPHQETRSRSNTEGSISHEKEGGNDRKQREVGQGSGMEIEEEGKFEEEKESSSTRASSRCSSGFRPYEKKKEEEKLWKLDFAFCEASFHDPKVFQFFETYFNSHFPNSIKSRICFLKKKPSLIQFILA